MDDIRDFIIEMAGYAIRIESHRLEEDQLTFTAQFSSPGETHKLEVTIREARETQ